MELTDATRALGALAQETRLQAFRLLVQAGPSGMSAGAIAGALDVPANTLSFHLSHLTTAGLVWHMRVGRSMIYRADFTHMNRLLSFLTESCCEPQQGEAHLPQALQAAMVQPCLGTQLSYLVSSESNAFSTAQALSPIKGSHPMSNAGNHVYNVLFLCTGNSARSILAEAAISRWSNGKFRGYSAGSHPKGEVHPMTLKVLKSLNYNTDGYRSKSWDEFSGEGAPVMDFVFTVCDNAASEICPVWPGQPMSAHWGVEDPAAVTGTEHQITMAFRRAYFELENRIKIFTSLRLEALDKLTLQTKLKSIGTTKTANEPDSNVA